MKTIQYKDLGGTCDEKLSANSWDEMGQRNEAKMGGGPRKLTGM